MEYRAVAKFIKMSPRKVRLVADAVRSLPIEDAKTSLESLSNRGAGPLLKALNSAVANAVNNGSANKGDLSIKEINITEGVRYKRYHYAGRGRVRPYVRRTSHIYVTVADKNHEGKELAPIKVDTNMKAKQDKKIETERKEASK